MRPILSSNTNIFKRRNFYLRMFASAAVEGWLDLTIGLLERNDLVVYLDVLSNV